MKAISINKTFFANFVTLEIDLEKLKYKSSLDQYKAYTSETPRKNNVQFCDTKYFSSCIKEAIEILMSSYNQKYKYDIIVKDIWEHEYKDNDFQEDHVHYNMHFSYIIYYKGGSKTVFKNPIGYTLQSMYSDFDDVLSQYEYIPNLEEGNMIVFPSFVPHYVKKQSNAKTIAGDIKIKRKKSGLFF
tara:strand:+ start:44 stop:601 length:558 start_codon:yes stop_codon:yes gene_type:complete